MTLHEISRPYETLIRHHADGGIASHHVRITEIYRDDGGIVSAMLADPLPLSLVDGDDLNFSKIIGDDCALALRANDALKVQLSAEQQNVAALHQQVESLSNNLEKVQQQISAFEQEKAELMGRLAAMQERNAELMAGFNSLQTNS